MKLTVELLPSTHSVNVIKPHHLPNRMGVEVASAVLQLASS